ncbi:hypothetical protein CAPTEDRAFT_189129 [Capitella teleta]|uniref:Uncharacterized protein n=1 Tax=Capitella teleta TaxID=283909 RepID=R7T7E3_CAPTE|nr:hypothetical protein CAPTEDRAFT_189129 [Capitella teleta]|eukprot:ELT87330.1 hypothetical protein CAPTEDRAFT_189129 [Capitella teleta]
MTNLILGDNLSFSFSDYLAEFRFNQKARMSRRRLSARILKRRRDTTEEDNDIEMVTTFSRKRKAESPPEMVGNAEITKRRQQIQELSLHVLVNYRYLSRGLLVEELRSLNVWLINQ